MDNPNFVEEQRALYKAVRSAHAVESEAQAVVEENVDSCVPLAPLVPPGRPGHAHCCPPFHRRRLDREFR